MSDSAERSVYCEHCGVTIAANARYCQSCGGEQGQVDGAAPQNPLRSANLPPTSQGTQKVSVRANTDLPDWFTKIPIELWLVIAAFTIPGGYLLLQALRYLPDTLSLLDEEFFGFRLGLALSLILIMVGLIGAGMLAISWMLYQLDRVGRGLAYVVAGSVVMSVVLSDNPSNTGSAEAFAAVASAVGAAVLALSPAVQRAFTGAQSRYGETPTSVVIARTAILLFSALAVIVGVSYLLVATVEVKFAVFGASMLAIALLGWRNSRPLMEGHRLTRQQISIAAGVLVVLMLAIGRGDTGLNFPIGLLVGSIAFLWLPSDSRRFFGDSELDLAALVGSRSGPSGRDGHRHRRD